MKQLSKKALSLLDKHGSIVSNKSKILKNWDYKKNLIDPKFVTENSRTSYWWICSKRKHSFFTNPYQVSIKQTQGCNKCYELDRAEIVRKYYLKNNLTLDEGDPFLAKQFDQKKNKRKANEINCQSTLKAWWICPNGHSFQAVVNKRYLRGDGCTKCGNTGVSRIQLIIEYELKTIFKNIVSDKKLENKYRLDIFIPNLNLVIEYDGKRFHNHKKDLIKNKVIKKSKLNLIRIREIPLKKTSNNDILYKSGETKPGHLKKLIDEILLKIKKLKIGSKYLKKINDYLNKENYQNERKWREVLAEFPKPPLEKRLSYLDPQLSKEWDLKKNHPLKPENYLATSKFSAWWRCQKCNHSWTSSIYSRYVRGDGCIKCYGKIRAEVIRLARLKNTGSIKKTHPKIAKEWDYKKNKTKPENYSYGSKTKVWWVCKKHKSYFMKINSRTMSNQGCGICGYIKSGTTRKKTIIKKIGSIKKTHPKIAKLWNYKKNKTLPNEYTHGSHFVAWWLCPKGHKTYKKDIKTMIRSVHGCRECFIKSNKK